MTSLLALDMAAFEENGGATQTGPRAGDPARAIGLALDVGACVLSLMLILSVTVAHGFVLRPVLALVFALFVPGWAMVRALGAEARILTIVGAVALSVSAMMIVGQGLVLFGDWKWYPVGLLGASLSALSTAASARRELQFRSEVAYTPRARAARMSSATTALTTVSVGLLLVVIGARSTIPARVDLYGLLDRLSAWYWLGVVVIIVGLVGGCRRAPRWAWLNVAGLAVALHGLPGLVQPHPRFGVSWIHAGFGQQIAEHGTLLTSLDARFSWAGFFSGAGFLQRLAGTDSLLWLVRFAPLFYNGCAIVLVALLARRLRATDVQAVVAGALFSVLNWIGQDYFAPQATAFVLYLTLIVVLLTVFPDNPSHMAGWMRRLVRPESDDARAGITSASSVWVLAGCYAVVVAITISHQLTPGFLLSATALLVLLRTVRTRSIPIYIGVVFVAWLSFGANAYWSGHFDTLTGSVGQVGSIVNQNVNKRAGSTQFGRQVVVYSRIGLAVAGWALAGIVIVIRWFQRRTPVALTCLLVAPFPMLPLQPYGGEMMLRVALFSLAPVTILLAMLIVPERTRMTARRAVAVGVVLAVLVVPFVTARFGNESFESFSDEDVAVSTAMYDTVPDGSLIFVQSRQTLLYWQRVDTVRFLTLPAGTGSDATAVLTDKYLPKSAVYIMLTESQEAYGIVSGGRTAGWLDELAAELKATGRYRTVLSAGDAVLMELESP